MSNYVLNEEFKKYYKFPLIVVDPYYSKVFTQDMSMAFDIPSFRGPLRPYVEVSVEEAKKIIAQINGETGDFRSNDEILYDSDSSTIYKKIDGKVYEFLIVRGWGNLTGIGAHNLDALEAVRIQDQFAMYIVERLRAR